MAEAADTPTAIIACAAQALREQTFDDISYRALADGVGVSERTVYRQFPTRSHLLEGLAEWIETSAFPLPAFVTIDEFRTAARSRFSAFDASPAYAFVCARAASISHTGESERPFLARTIEAMIVTSYPEVNARDRRRVSAALCYFASPQFWARMRTGFDMGAPEIGEVFDRTVGLAIDRLPKSSRMPERVRNLETRPA